MTPGASPSGEGECLCLVCVEPFANSRPREIWFQCVKFKQWAHEKCTPGKAIYVRQKLNSDDES